MTASPQIIIAKDEAALSEKVAHIFMEATSFAVRDNGRALVALTGGNSPKKYLPHLVSPYFRGRIPWMDTYFFFTDERCVPPHHPHSNYNLAKESLFSKAVIPQEKIFRMAGEMESPVEAARIYEQSMKTIFGGTTPWPVFDLILLGLGEDGHMASLFPNTAALKDKMHWAVANFVDKAPIGNLPANRITLTLPVINHARKIVVVCSGVSKAGIVKEVLREDLPSGRYPAQFILPEAGELIWLLDKQAASKLPAILKTRAANV